MSSEQLETWNNQLVTNTAILCSVGGFTPTDLLENIIAGTMPVAAAPGRHPLICRFSEKSYG
ncbi:MAG: hypothetical protein KA314_04330 [Chloroflexi bacterium]|nr:hypothetical protein [Chloroflexota bacterium]MBP8055040.1 hypothetical protein [Chloroflexota bacterium]